MEWIRSAWEALGESPVGRCASYTPSLLRVERVADLLIWAAYWYFPARALAVAIGDESARRAAARFLGLVALTGAFIIFCGATHILKVATGYRPGLLPLDGSIRLATAAISWAAVAAIEGAARTLAAAPSSELARRAAHGARRGLLAYAVLVAVAAGIGGVGTLGYRSIADLIDQAGRHRDDSLAILAVRDGVEWCRRAESAQRYYLLGANGPALADYREAAHEARDRLDRSGRSSTWTAAEVATLRGEIEAKLAELDETIAESAAGRPGSALAVVLGGRGRDLMAAIDADAGRMIGRALDVVDARTARLGRSGSTAMAAIPLVGSLAVVAVAGSVLVLVRQARRSARERAESDILAAEARAAIAEKQAAVVQAEVARSEAALARREGERAAMLLNAVSHDTRTPLNAIRQQADLAGMILAIWRDPAADRPKLVECVRSVKLACDVAKQTVDSMLEAARTEVDLPVVVSFRLEPLLREVVDLLRSAADPKGLLLIARCPDDLVARTDRAMARRAVANLVENAIKYTERGSVTLSAAQDPGGDGVEIRVADTGPGVDPAILPRLFGDFVQANNPERDSRKGFGLGLANVRRTAEALGGRAAVESAPGHGATFVLRLPDLPPA